MCSSQCAYSEGPAYTSRSGFVLDKFSILNVRENNGNLKVVNQNRGVLLFDLEPLSGLIQALYITMPVMPRRIHPLGHYWRTSSE